MYEFHSYWYYTLSYWLNTWIFILIRYQSERDFKVKNFVMSNNSYIESEISKAASFNTLLFQCSFTSGGNMIEYLFSVGMRVQFSFPLSNVYGIWLFFELKMLWYYMFSQFFRQKQNHCVLNRWTACQDL